MKHRSGRWAALLLLCMGCATHSSAQRGRQALAAGHDLEATRLLSEATSHRPEDASVWRDLALARLRSGQLEAARVAIEEAASLRPSDPSIVLLRGQIRAALRDYSAAIADVQWAADHSGDPAVLEQAAIVLLRLDRSTAGLQTAKRAVEASDGAADAYVNLAVLAVEADRMQVAEQTLREGLRHHPRDLGLLQTLAALLSTRGRHAEARELYRNLLQRHPRPGLIHLALALLAHEQGDLADAELHARAAVQAEGHRRADVHHTYVIVLRDRGHAKRARRHLERALRRFPGNPRLQGLRRHP